MKITADIDSTSFGIRLEAETPAEASKLAKLALNTKDRTVYIQCSLNDTGVVGWIGGQSVERTTTTLTKSNRTR